MKKVLILLLLASFLVPCVSSAQLARQASQRISFDFIDADVRNVLRVLSEVGKKNIIIAEDVKGKVTIKLEEVPIEEAFDVIMRNNDLARIEEENVTRVVTIKKLNDERDRETKQRLDFLKAKEAKLKSEEEFVTETVYVNYADVEDVARMIRGENPSSSSSAAASPASTTPPAPPTTTTVERTRGLLSPGGVVTIVKWDKALIIRDTRENVANILKVIKEHDIRPRQVQIEARIVQASSTFSKQLGVQWAASYRNKARGENFEVNPTVTMPGPTGTTAGTLGILVGGVNESFNLNLTLSALESQGLGKVISNPKVVTSENKTAIISQGTQIPYQTSSANTGVNIEFKDAVLQLEVTPYVVRDGTIRMTIKAKKDQPNFDARFPVPGIDKREATTELLVRDGETTVLGGIYELQQNDNTNGVPLLSRIPLLGWLFKSIDKTDQKNELLIFVTPMILKDLYAEEKRDQ
jgi:type IV pilus assembly protein PilQ